MGMPLRSIDDGNQGGLSDLPVKPEPTLAGRKPKSWHAVIGTLSIIIGVLGLVCWGCGSFNTVTMATGNPAGYDATQATSSNGTYAEIKITKAVDESDDAASETKLDQPNLAGRQGPMDIVLHFVSFLLSIMLLVGGIGMINRKPWSRSTLMLWAWLKILITIIWLIWQFAFINDQIPLIAEECEEHGAARQRGSVRNGRRLGQARRHDRDHPCRPVLPCVAAVPGVFPRKGQDQTESNGWAAHGSG